MKRQRGRNRRSNNQNNANRSMESNGPDVKVRGTAKQIFEKYETLARDAASSGNRVKAENCRQHAEHYLRIVNAMEAVKQAKEEAEAAARAEANADGSDAESGSDRKEDNRSKRRYPPQVRKSSNSDKDISSKTADNEPAVQGLDVVETEAVQAPKAKSSSRRRKAPSREETTTDPTSEAAE